LVGLDQDVAAQPREQVQMLHPGDGVPAPRSLIDRCGDVLVRPLRAVVREYGADLLRGESPGVAVVTVLEAHGPAVQQALAAGPLRDAGAQPAERPTHTARHLLERCERERLLVDRVAAEKLVRALAREDDLDVLSGLAGHEVEG